MIEKLYHISLALVFSLLFALPNRSIAKQTSDQATHWAYSTLLGTGIYSLNQGEMFILSLSGRYPIHEGPRIGYQFLGGLTVGLNQYGLTEDGVEFPSGVGSLQFAPGLQIDCRIHERWSVKPFSQFGVGNSFVGGNNIYSLALGIRSVYQISVGRLKVDIGNALMTARHIDGELSSDLFGKFDTGLNIKPPSSFSLFDTRLNLHFFVMYSLFTSGADQLFESSQSERAPLSWLGQLGFDFGRVSERKRIRAGLRYVFGEENLAGVRLHLGFPF